MATERRGGLSGISASYLSSTLFKCRPGNWSRNSPQSFLSLACSAPNWVTIESFSIRHST